jgi:Protein of unknown function (DUF4013)
MDLSASTRAIKNLFSFPFQDPAWKNKFLIGCGVSLAGIIIPVIPSLFALGYIARLMRMGANNEDAARLPVWDDWGDLFMDGLRQFGVIFLFTLPAMIIMGAGWLLYIFGMVSITGGAHDPSRVGGQTIFMLVSMAIFFLAISAGLLLSLAAWLVMPAAQVHVAVNHRFGALFDVAGWWRLLRANFGGFMIASGMFFVLMMGLGLVSQLLYFTMVLCLLIPLIALPASFYTLLVVYRLAGQAYGEGSAKAASAVLPAPVAPEAA